jgi:hypothetical protein
MLDRLALDANRVEAMAAGVEAIAAMPDPVGRVTSEWQRPNGLSIQRVSVPLGVIGIIYESRPNVTVDAAALCLKSGNAAILRGGSESFQSNMALHECVQVGLTDAGIGADAVQFVPTTDRDAVGYLLSGMSRWLDVVVPRGGKGLIRRVQQDARVPVIGHLEGICHVYLHAAAAIEMARDITVNAKMRRTGICGAAETLLVDRAGAESLLPGVASALLAAGCELRGDAEVCALVSAASSKLDFPQFDRTGAVGRLAMMSGSMARDGLLRDLLPPASGLSGGIGMWWRRAIEGSCAAGATRLYRCDDDASHSRLCWFGPGATGPRPLVVHLPRLLHGTGLEACSCPRRRGGAGPAQAYGQRGAAGHGAGGQTGLRPLPRGAEPGALGCASRGTQASRPGARRLLADGRGGDRHR